MSCKGGRNGRWTERRKIGATLKINVDCAFLGDKARAGVGVGVVIRDHEGDIHNCFHGMQIGRNLCYLERDLSTQELLIPNFILVLDYCCPQDYQGFRRFVLLGHIVKNFLVVFKEFLNFKIRYANRNFNISMHLLL